MYRNQLFQIINYKMQIKSKPSFLIFNNLMFNACTAKIDKIFFLFLLISDSFYIEKERLIVFAHIMNLILFCFVLLNILEKQIN